MLMREKERDRESINKREKISYLKNIVIIHVLKAKISVFTCMYSNIF
jgi:hypothetical protein